MRNDIATIILSIIILGKSIGIINILLGKYTSNFVSYFTVAPIDSYQLKDLSKEEQKKFNYLASLSSVIDIIISFVIIIFLSKVTIEVILFLSFLLYANSLFFSKYMSKVFKLIY
ncbi:hypothetical protein SAMN04488700_0952 [Carnobacterium iners]|uniref:Uncharacterized protein n=1 Tax=Carnobacterium iners TaxID=1073423 RepID=A0A1X7MW57_9LACT|nr:hypothetical protein [Carnobacterium iners]SEL21287.1 hypothetical protein SAMN04488114_1365 [Carnobacterium iners]SMH28629.1 hypothetical protein SAMN04488700_0952 [Carnobacterium iners]